MSALTQLLRSPGVSSIGVNQLGMLGYDVAVWTDSPEVAERLATQLSSVTRTVTRDVIDGDTVDYHDWHGGVDGLRVRITYAEHIPAEAAEQDSYEPTFADFRWAATGETWGSKLAALGEDGAR